MKTNSHINIYPQICMLKIARINDRNDTLEQHSKFSQIQLMPLKTEEYTIEWQNASHCQNTPA